MKISQQITMTLIALIVLVVLALIFQTWLGIPEEAVKYLEYTIAGPALAALLTAWKAWSGQEDPP